MADKTGSQKKPAKRPRPRRPSTQRDSAQPAALHSPGDLAELPDHSNALPARLDALLQLQRQLGNKVVQRQIAQREAAQHQIAGQEEDQDRPISTKGLGLKKELEGHPYSLIIQREDEVAAEEVKTPTADISVKLKKPTVNRISEKKVQEKHGKEDIAGYTKPEIGISVPKLKKREITIVITLKFVMDLAKEYKGGRLQVLRDHENAHMLIAEKVANEFVAGPLKDELEAMPEFNEGNKEEIQGKFAAKLADFATEEGTASQDFDDVDYPRMDDAYHGVATPLADLISGSAEVKAMVEAVDAFSDGAKAAAADAEALGALTQAISDGQDALGETNLARLQYNPDFKKKVAKAQKAVAALLKKPDTLAEEVKAKLDELTPILDKFTWQPDFS